MHSIRLTHLVVLLFILITIASTAIAASDEALLWEKLENGSHIAVMRHAIAPGNGDPADFSLRDCDTQRNLSIRGRQQAQRIGARFRENGINNAQVYSSQWCRCLDTAKLLGIGQIEELSALNSFFRLQDQAELQTIAMMQWLQSRNSSLPTILVTHQVNITALTGVYPSSGEIVIIQPQADGRVVVAGTIETE